MPVIDLSRETARQVVVAARTKTNYREQVNTVLMADGETMFATWSIGHGGKAGPMKKSTYGDRTWSVLLSTRANWRGISSCPCIFRITDRTGAKRLIVLARRGRLDQSLSLDTGCTWSPIKLNGLFKPGGNTVIIPIGNGRRRLLLAHRGPIGKPQIEKTQAIWQATSDDGGQTRTHYRKVCEVSGTVPCEPELIRSPDGRQLLCLMRENSRRIDSIYMISNDEGKTWNKACELTAGHYVAWIGRYADIIRGREGQYCVKLLHHHGAPADCGYSGLECLPNGIMVATTFIKYRPGLEKNSIISVRFQLKEIDAKAPRKGKWQQFTFRLFFGGTSLVSPPAEFVTAVFGAGCNVQFPITV